MREHAIPQDVTGYRFHIVGNMTLKQFAEVAIGVVVGIVLYKTNLIPVVKWPLILLSAGAGVAIAFVPIEERPLDHWLSIFFGILYRPTQFFWRKQAKIPDPFLYKLQTGTIITPEEVDLSPARRERIQEYLTSVRQSQTTDPWEQEQHQRSQSILSQFDSIRVNKVSISQTAQKPNLQVRVRELHAPVSESSVEDAPNQVPSEATPVMTTPPDIISQAPIELPVSESPPPENVSFSQPAAILPTTTTPESPVSPTTVTQSVSETVPSLIEESQSPIEAVIQNPIAVPQVQPPTPIPTENPTVPTEPAIDIPVTPDTTPQTEVFMSNAVPTPEPETQPTIASIHSDQLPFPTKPTTPNKVVGMVFTPDGKILPNAIVEIRNMRGEVARAVKTNPLGQFFITTPLENGEYLIATEKEGYVFQNQQLTLAGTLIDPIQIVSQG